jgi:hypothetical protein
MVPCRVLDSVDMDARRPRVKKNREFLMRKREKVFQSSSVHKSQLSTCLFPVRASILQINATQRHTDMHATSHPSGFLTLSTGSFGTHKSYGVSCWGIRRRLSVFVIQQRQQRLLKR